MDQNWLPFQQRPFFPDLCQSPVEIFSREDSVAVSKVQQLSQSWAGKPRGYKEYCVAKPRKCDNGDDNVQPRLGQNSNHGGLFRGGFLSEASPQSAVRRYYAVIDQCEDPLRR